MKADLVEAILFLHTNISQCKSNGQIGNNSVHSPIDRIQGGPFKLGILANMHTWLYYKEMKHNF